MRALEQKRKTTNQGWFMFYLFISSGDHTEVISIDYDPTKITYLQLLDLFWNNHEYGLTKKQKRQVSANVKNSWGGGGTFRFDF